MARGGRALSRIRINVRTDGIRSLDGQPMTDPITTLTGYVIAGMAIALVTTVVAVCWYGADAVFGAIARDYEEWKDDRWK